MILIISKVNIDSNNDGSNSVQNPTCYYSMTTTATADLPNGFKSMNDTVYFRIIKIGANVIPAHTKIKTQMYPDPGHHGNKFFP